MLINVRGPIWQGQGRLGRYQQLSTDAFRLWLARLRKERLPALIKFLGQSLADGVLDQRERLILGSFDRSHDLRVYSRARKRGKRPRWLKRAAPVLYNTHLPDPWPAASPRYYGELQLDFT